MAHCAVCGEEAPGGARFCPRCGALQQQSQRPGEQLYLPGFGAPALSVQPDGSIAFPQRQMTERKDGHPLTTTQVAITFGTILVLVLGFLWYVSNRHHGAPATADLPVMGIIGEPVDMGKTVLGVAFTGTPDTFNQRTSVNGRFLAVGIVIGNRSGQTIALDEKAFALTDGKNDSTYQPVVIGYGTPDQLDRNNFQRQFQLPDNQVIAAIAVFDISPGDTAPRLLIRDLSGSDAEFTGAIDLTKNARQTPDQSPSGFRPLMTAQK